MPRSPASAPPGRRTPGPAQARADLSTLRPDLVAAYDAELPGARAAILARLLGALDRESLPGLVGRRPGEARFAPPEACSLQQENGLARREDRREAEMVVTFSPEAAVTFAAGNPGLGAALNGDPIDDPATLVRHLWPGTYLADEIDNSVANLALSRANKTARAGLDPRNLGEAEQLVTDGHPLHPCCRTRGGMTTADVLAYAPEHAPVIRLRRLRVPADRWYGPSEPVLYAHPWQAEHLRARYPWLTDDGETGPARPLMSLRTVAPLDGGPHIKTAIDVQMTSAVRTVSPAAVHNGPILSELLRKLTADLPIDILAETAAGAVLVDGQPQRHLAFLRRDAPQLKRGEIALPLAMLSSAPVRLVRVHDAYEMMAQLSDLLFAPLLALLDRGVALEAHGQNTLVVLRDGRPVRILYRDLGGVRVSTKLGLDLQGDLPTDDPQVLRTKVAASAFGTVASELIANSDADPGKMWRILAEAINRAGTKDAERLIEDPLPVKATTAMRLADDPLEDRWALLDNPMAA